MMDLTMAVQMVDMMVARKVAKTAAMGVGR
jgi:hypothetical protein